MTTKNERFTMRLTTQDKEIFAYLAAKLHRNESDALRLIARNFAEALQAEDAATAPNPTAEAQR